MRVRRQIKGIRFSDRKIGREETISPETAELMGKRVKQNTRKLYPIFRED